MAENEKKKIALSFSGKDSVLALHRLIYGCKNEYETVLLLSTAVKDYKRTSIHGVRTELLEFQAKSIGIDLKIAWLPGECPDHVYQKIMAETCGELKSAGINCIAFGDIFLADVREYREKMLARSGMEAVFPLWGTNTADAAKEFLALGYKAIITCVDTEKLPENFSGRIIDEDLLASLPEGVDICGENGEYHSFVFDGPIFRQPIAIKTGEKRMAMDVHKGKPRFCFTDILPGI